MPPPSFWRSETADSHRRNYSNEAGDHNPDEPTAMLDPAGRREVMETIRYLNREEGITIVHITHYMEEAIDAHRVIVMEEGRIVMEGSPREVFVKVEELKSLGLDVPQITELAYELRKEGIDIPPGLLTAEEMVKALCQS